MKASIVIPLWNGEAVIGRCLEAIYAQPDPDLLEVICVDNASRDASARFVTQRYPQVKLLPQAVNLGFAGGVNVGLAAAHGDLMILLNQDCLVYPGWLPALADAFQQHPEFGLLGCTVYNVDGSLNHTGAYVRSPDALGVHVAEANDQLHVVEFATGASLGIRRETLQRLGPLDDDYYPAYYEDVDYCYRARHAGILTAVVPGAKVQHIFSSRTWQSDPIWHTTNGYLGRYRFVSKHFDRHQTAEFFAAEHQNLAQIEYLDHALGRMIAARHTERSLPAILERRELELDERLDPADQRQLQVELAYLAQEAFRVAEGLVKKPSVGVADRLAEAAKPFDQMLSSLNEQETEAEKRWADNYQHLLGRRQLEEQVSLQLRSSMQPDRPPQKAMERSRTVLRNLKFLIYSDLMRLVELDGLQTQRMDDLHERGEIAAHRAGITAQRADLDRLRFEKAVEWLASLDVRIGVVEERLKLIELLMEHERE